ncbi:flotillin-like protein 2 [Setaria italica]|uniref:flotillin-like protein 2 n=1 Tax=Setaria italica TaxID=4555 RepID=UPI000350A4D6|nr:flotillin-like protein 2 [Setaria italica]
MEVKVAENEREALVVAAVGKLATKKAGWDQKAKLAEVEAAMAVARRPPRGRAPGGDRAQEGQVPRREAQGRAALQGRGGVRHTGDGIERRVVRPAEGGGGGAVRAGEGRGGVAVRAGRADAQLLERKLAEDAKLYASQKQAESPAAIGGAKAAYVASMLEALGGDHRALRNYLMIDSTGVCRQETAARVDVSASAAGGNNGVQGGAMQQVCGRCCRRRRSRLARCRRHRWAPRATPSYLMVAVSYPYKASALLDGRGVLPVRVKIIDRTRVAPLVI